MTYKQKPSTRAVKKVPISYVGEAQTVGSRSPWPSMLAVEEVDRPQRRLD
jgi:hypothetical protein